VGQNFKLLDIDINPLRNDYVLPIGALDQNLYRLLPRQVLNEDIIGFFSVLGYIPVSVLVFHQVPGCTNQVIHLDGSGIFEFAINWIYSESPAMRWYKKTDKIPDVKVHPLTNTNYITYDNDAVEFLEETRDHGPLLVNIGDVPHNALNLSDTTDRWSISVRFIPNWSRSWDSVVSDFAMFTCESR
jgi:hypothetical protein